MNFTKQLSLGSLLLLMIGLAIAKPNTVDDVSSYESLLLPGSQLIAAGNGEFFITGKVQQPVVASQANHHAQLVPMIKPAVAKASGMDVADKRITQLFALHHSIEAASLVKQPAKLGRYAAVRGIHRSRVG